MERNIIYAVLHSIIIIINTNFLIIQLKKEKKEYPYISFLIALIIMSTFFIFYNITDITEINTKNEITVETVEEEIYEITKEEISGKEISNSKIKVNFGEHAKGATIVNISVKTQGNLGDLNLISNYPGNYRKIKDDLYYIHLDVEKDTNVEDIYLKITDEEGQVLKLVKYNLK